ncbi:MAG: phosphatidate cytidylyltransferase [Pseudomonadota bacterium]
MADAKSAPDAARMRGDGFWVRAASSLVLIPIVLAAVFAGGRVFAALVAFAAIVMIFEWTRMVERRELSPAFYVLAVTAGGALALGAGGAYPWAYLTCVAGGAGAFFVAGRKGGDVTVSPAWPAAAAFYIVAPSIALLWLRLDVENGRALTFFLYAAVWAGDTGAYTVGKLIGGPKLSPVLSPGKTWAGLFGGVGAGALAGVAAAGFFDAHVLLMALCGAGLGGASVIGDMIESASKRRFGVKDVSGFIPGHGGALDRMDGMILATTAMTAMLFAYMLAGKF